MHYYEIAVSKIFRAGSDFLTYSSEAELPIGQIVNVEIGKKHFSGIVAKKVKKPIYPTKAVVNIIEQKPIPKPILELIYWISSYYITPIATVIQTVLPSGLSKKRQIKDNSYEIVKRNRTKILFNDEQLTVINQVDSYENGTFLLHGITGSGKTEVYIELAKHAINSGRSVIILIPEISLTPQMISEFSNHFEDLIVTHSRMTESARHKAWLKALNSDQPGIVIGPRSALFTPFKDVGLIIIDEAHEPSFKQDQSPRYSALRAASMLGKFNNAKVIFGSATPSVSDRFLAEKSNRPILKLTKVARSGSSTPNISLIDMTKKDNFKKHRFISDKLIEHIATNLEAGTQTLIFHNRRGSTQTTACYKCGWKADCPNCFIPLSLHGDKHQLQCHTCNHTANIPTSCPECKSAEIVHKGIGTKLIETEITKLFPDACIARFDADNKADDTVNARYDDLYTGKIDIAIGTQTIAKGLDLPHLRTVGVIQADAGLALPDFFSNERVFQLLTQVIGRVGRNEHETNAVIQSYQPNHPSIQYSLTQNYELFYKNALIERQNGRFPPFAYILKLTCIYKTEAAAIKNAKQLSLELKTKINSKDIQILGPTPAFYERQHGTYRWQLTLRSMKRQLLADIISEVPIGKNWQADLDPTSLL